MTDDEHANTIRNLTGTLNNAIMAANDAGLFVTFDTIDRSMLSSPVPLQILNPKISRFL